MLVLQVIGFDPVACKRELITSSKVVLLSRGVSWGGGTVEEVNRLRCLRVVRCSSAKKALVLLNGE